MTQQQTAAHLARVVKQGSAEEAAHHRVPCRNAHRAQAFSCHMAVSIVRCCLPCGVPVFNRWAESATLCCVGAMKVRQRVAHTHGFAVMENRSEQALTAKRHVAKPL